MGKIFVSPQVLKIIYAVKKSACKADENGTLRTSHQKLIDYFKDNKQEIISSVRSDFFTLAQQEEWLVLLNEGEKRKKVFTLTDKLKNGHFVVGGKKGKSLSLYTVKKRRIEEKQKKSSSGGVDKAKKLPFSDLEKLEKLIQQTEQKLEELKNIRFKLVEGENAKKELEKILSEK